MTERTEIKKYLFALKVNANRSVQCDRRLILQCTWCKWEREVVVLWSHRDHVQSNGKGVAGTSREYGTVLVLENEVDLQNATISCSICLHNIYRVSLSLEAPNYCLCIQSNSAGFSFVNTGKQVHLKHARLHFERNLVKDVRHRSVASRNWLKS